MPWKEAREEQKAHSADGVEAIEYLGRPSSGFPVSLQEDVRTQDGGAKLGTLGSSNFAKSLESSWCAQKQKSIAFQKAASAGHCTSHG